MNWSMPRPVLQMVAAALALVSIAAFAMGVAGAKGPARLPGETPSPVGEPIIAQEATPLTDERLQGADDGPDELTPEEKAKAEAEAKAKAEADAAAKAEAEKGAAAGPVGGAPAAQPAAQPDRIGEALEKAQPAPPKLEEPVF